MSRVRLPVRVLVVEGVKVIWMVQEALGARVWVQGELVVVTRVKSPVAVVELRVMGEGVALVRVKAAGALVLAMGMGPKSEVVGERRSPVRGRPVPVRLRV